MTVKLNKKAYDHAKSLAKDKQFKLDEMGDWSEHQPSTDQENAFIEKHGMDEYAKWHLGVDDEQDESNKGRYKFPFGDFKKAHRCGVIAVKMRAAQRDYDDIEKAADHLKDMLDELM
ncbi:hypothetical protein [Sphaerisporangium dianthi]|uniref:Uncharacterized protein n=1 Tax=Sphaerisporangium dianthi TaxID=1436120 RepID=A0ABV9CM58_9ACTN